MKTASTGSKADLEPFELEKATKIAPGVTLFTRDGTQIGNAIVVKQSNTAIHRAGEDKPDPVWIVETDFGNRLRPTGREIDQLWTLGFQSDYDTWFSDRAGAIGSNQ